LCNYYYPDASDGEIVLTVSGGTSPYLYNWNDGSSGSVLYNLARGSYSVTVTDNNNCTKSESFSVSNLNEFCFDIPDIITPNGDGKNDEWVIEGLQIYPDVTVEIYDRWGKRVFYSRGYDVNFDGKFNGKDLPTHHFYHLR
jgi:gliding motility-associated-like protein